VSEPTTRTDSGAKALRVLGDLMPEMEPDIHQRWVKRLTDKGRDPLEYAEAMKAKAKQLDGCDGFFFAMQRDEKEDDWLSGALKKIRRRNEKLIRETWPYPRGHITCTKCNTQGWYSLKRHALDEEHEAALDAHHDQGYAPVIMVHPELETERVVFICKDCNPDGRMEAAFQDKIFPRYPVGGAPYEFVIGE